ncbi:MAG TPA: flagellar hook capping FlgD N-terminal domain-containing protein [Polyangiaceae bacterium]|nr:flagellar hook capping FlgD N-terminal domain-containing protein [Polyangiaceae bacterium]
MVDSVSSKSSAASAAGLTSALGGDKALGKDAFLKLLVAQLKHQDPLKPQDDSAFVAQLAQFSSLEQTMGINSRLDTLSAQSQGLQNSQVISMVGKEATVKGSLVTSDGSGAGVPVAFTLDGKAASTQIVIKNQAGNTVRTIDVGAKDAGTARITWDGRSDTGIVQPAGTYQITVQAKNDSGAPVSVSQETKGMIESVSFDKGYPVLNLDTGVSVPVSDLLQVESPPNTK